MGHQSVDKASGASLCSRTHGAWSIGQLLLGSCIGQVGRCITFFKNLNLGEKTRIFKYKKDRIFTVFYGCCVRNQLSR